MLKGNCYFFVNITHELASHYDICIFYLKKINKFILRLFSSSAGPIKLTPNVFASVPRRNKTNREVRSSPGASLVGSF